MNKKIQEKVLKDIKKRWSDKTQIGFSELAIQEIILQTIELCKHGNPRDKCYCEAIIKPKDCGHKECPECNKQK